MQNKKRNKPRVKHPHLWAPNPSKTFFESPNHYRVADADGQTPERCLDLPVDRSTFRAVASGEQSLVYLPVDGDNFESIVDYKCDEQGNYFVSLALPDHVTELSEYNYNEGVFCYLPVVYTTACLRCREDESEKLVTEVLEMCFVPEMDDEGNVYRTDLNSVQEVARAFPHLSYEEVLLSEYDPQGAHTFWYIAYLLRVRSEDLTRG